MPSFITNLRIESTGGVTNFGDSFYIAPKSAAKTYAGSGSVNTANVIVTNNGLSAINTLDTEVQDQSIISSG
ncbi:MAG: spore germination protein [Bacilli bacterium]